MFQFAFSGDLGRIEVRGQGDEPLVKEACMWMVEQGKTATTEGSLSEGAYLELCNLSKAKYVGVCPTRHRKTLEVLGETIVRTGETESLLSNLKHEHTALQEGHYNLLSTHKELQITHKQLLLKHSNLQDRYIEEIRKNKLMLTRETSLINKNRELMTRNIVVIKADTARTNLLAECMQELHRRDAWTKKLEQLEDRDMEALDELLKLQVRDAEKEEAADESLPLTQRPAYKRKRGEAGGSAEA